jgi:hypothetical protein
MFVDADDYIVPGGLERLLVKAEEMSAEVLKYRVMRVSSLDPTDTVSVHNIPLCETLFSGLGEALRTFAVSDYNIYDGLYLRQLIIDHNIRFHNDLYLHEDDTFMAELYVHARRVVSTQLPLYRYVVNSSQSSTHGTDPQRARRMVASAPLAIRYRRSATDTLHDKSVDTIEKVKAMRIVYACSRNMITAKYCFSEYRNMLHTFQSYGCWPLQYRWMKDVLVPSLSLTVKTFLCNHPHLAWLVYNKKWK